MRILLSLFVTLFCSFTVCMAEETPIWPNGKIPLKTSEKPERVLRSSDDIIRLTDINTPSLTPCLVQTETEAPAVVICPGGGYGILAWNHEGTEIAAWLNQLGYHAFILKYRVPNNRDAALCDAQRAIRFVRAHAKQFKVNPKQIGIIGFSAGAHLSVRTCTNGNKGFYPPVDAIDNQPCRPDYALIIYPAYLFKKGTFEMSPELSVTAAVPPTFLLQALDDRPLIDSSITYLIALKAAGVATELHIYPKGGHGYGLRQNGNPTQVWGDLAASWLKRTVK